MGRKAVAASCLEYLAASPQFHVVGVLCDSHLEVSPTRDKAVFLGIPVMHHGDVDEMIKQSSLEFDLGISVLYWRKIKGLLLTHPPLGIINFHPAPLPELKGFGGYNIAILDGLVEYGVTAHYVDAEIDTGRIIQVDRFSIDGDTETAQSTVEFKSCHHLATQFQTVMVSVLASPLHILETTPNEGGKYTSRKEMNELKKVVPGDDVDVKIRAFWFPPYEGALAEVNGKWYSLINQGLLRSLADPWSSSTFTSPV
jgi:methionyl-tRNA formyltransferase